jgi:predicted dehydrogenase
MTLRIGILGAARVARYATIAAAKPGDCVTVHAIADVEAMLAAELAN